MDPLSQGVLGAVAAGTFARREALRPALFAGGVAGMLADLDVLIASSEDPLLQIEYHRHFTHSLAFIPIGGLVAAVGLWLVLRKWLGFRELYLYSTLGYATAGLLDACTSYGTRLLWPFSDERLAWNVISIIDPVFTAPLLLAVVWGFWKRKPALPRVAIGFALLYLLFGSVQRDRAMIRLEQLVAERGHSPARMQTVKPSFANLLVWRAMYEKDGKLYVDAIRVPYWGDGYRIYEGEVAELVEVERLISELPEGSAAVEDVVRFEHFSDGYVVWHPENDAVLADARYAILPNSMHPLWGVVVNRDEPETHGAFLEFRDRAREEGPLLLKMIRGEALSD